MCDVLVLEDDCLVRTLIVETLEDEGLSVAAASSLQEARTVMASHPFPRVLLVDHDLREPDLTNGFDFARDRLSTSSGVAAIYMTARWHLLAEYPPSARERQLRKPFRLVDMVRSVRELLPEVA